MIIVVLGGSESLRSDVISQIMATKISLIRHLSLEGLVKREGAGLVRLKAEFDQFKPKLTNFITLVSGISSAKELDYLRGRQAFICHCYGPLSKLYDHLACDKSDAFILPYPLPFYAPGHIYTPDEVLSECYIKG
jgi:hypothetical protein